MATIKYKDPNTGDYVNIPMYAGGGWQPTAWGDITGDITNQADLKAALATSSQRDSIDGTKWLVIGDSNSDPATAYAQVQSYVNFAPMFCVLF